MGAISVVFAVALHGQFHKLASVESAIALVDGFDEERPGDKFVRYEVDIRYTNQNEIRGTFESKIEAIKFLRSMA